MKNKFLILIIFLICFFLFRPNEVSSENLQQEKSQENLQHEVTVTLKLIQVYVTDEEGNPVLDLEKSDFILYDNEKLQTITDFEKHVLAKIERKTKEKKDPKTSSWINRKFLILLDILGNDKVGIIQSKEAALHFIDTKLQPEDEVGILSYTPLSGLNLHTYLTTDHDLIKKAIKEAKEIPINNTRAKTFDELQQEEEQKVGAKRGSSLGEETYTTRLFMEPFKIPGLRDIKKGPLQLIREVSELAKALMYIPGIKHIMFFSGGGPQKFHKYYERLGMELAGANCIVHTINAMGTRSHFLGGNRPSEMTLEMLAGASGGKYFSNVSDYEVIAEDVQSLSGNYYVLGYYIGEKWDGRFHKVQVNVKRKGCLVYTQGGYYNPKPFSRFSEFEKKLHLIDLALSDKPYFQDPLNVPLITLPCSYKEEFNCVLLSKLPLEYLGGIQGEKLELVNLILDEEKKIIDSSRGEVDYSELLQGRNYQYSILSLLPGHYECRVVLRNLTSGKSAVGSSRVKIPDYQESGVFLYSPLLLIPDKKSHFLKLSTIERKTEEKDGISLIHIYPFLSNEYSPLIEELEQQKNC
jgi:VWFA-related protein